MRIKLTETDLLWTAWCLVSLSTEGSRVKPERCDGACHTVGIIPPRCLCPLTPRLRKYFKENTNLSRHPFIDRWRCIVYCWCWCWCCCYHIYNIGCDVEILSHGGASQVWPAKFSCDGSQSVKFSHYEDRKCWRSRGDLYQQHLAVRAHLIMIIFILQYHNWYQSNKWTSLIRFLIIF